MPLLEGTDLQMLLDRAGPLPAARAVEITDQVAAALDAAHGAGLVHRDVKPTNVLITHPRADRDFVYLIDFGIARALDGTVSRAEAVVGTPAFMAPERFTGEGDQRGDIYALTCVLYAMLTGRPPFEPADAALLTYAFAHLHEPVPRPSTRVQALPSTLDDVIARGMAKDPDDRYATAGDLAAAARAAVSSTPTAPALDDALIASTSTVVVQPRSDLADGATVVVPSSTGPLPSLPTPPPAPPPPPGTPPRPRRSVTRGLRRRPRPAIAVAAVVLMVVGALVSVGVVTRSAATPPASPATAVGPPIAERQLTSKYGYVYAVATARLGERPVVVTGNSDGSVAVWDMLTGAIVDEPLTGHRGFVDAVTTARLGDRTVIVSGGRDGTVRVWDLATHAAVGAPIVGYADTVATLATAELNGRPVIIAGGSHLLDGRDLAGVGVRTVRAWDLDTHAEITDFPGDAGSVFTAVTAPLDGHTVVVTGGADRAVHVRDLATGTPVGPPLLGHTDWVSAMATVQLGTQVDVVTGGRDGTVRVWDLAGHAPVGPPVRDDARAVTTLTTAVLDDRPVIVVGGADGTIEVRDVATRAVVGAPVKGHTGAVEALATAQVDGRTVLVSGGRDRTLHTWDLSAHFHP